MPLSSRRPDLGVLVMLGLLTAFGPLSFDMYLPALPRLAADLGTSDAGAQLSLSLCMLGLGIGQVVTGPLSDRLGRKTPMYAGIGLFTVMSVACALAPTLPALLAARFLQGLGGGAGAVIARTMVRDLYSGKAAARAYGVTALVFGVAPVVAPLLGSLLLSFTGWRGIFVAIACCGAVLVGLATRLPETLPPAERHDGGLTSLFADFPRVLRDPTLLMPALVLALGFMPLSLYLSMSSFALEHGYGLTATQFGLVFAANSLGILLMGRVNLRLVQTMSSYRILVRCLGLSLVACALVAAATVLALPVWCVLVPLWVAIASIGPVMPNATTLALERQQGAVGAAAACVGLVQTVLAAVVPPAVSLVGAGPVVMGVSMLVLAVVAQVPLRLVPQEIR